ncbi:unnamed protein product [Vitrella brassicaformis CCMP3155]|uniref:Uncharacterized protein n=3 Tax=Vitrella brassicaformis TaxID=1169539 RepID=A0A0G4GEC3_VITBC|nr:unnamed protein product [Vitrella brassicaformis CCMP3155]|eukprot:CEM27471.1 unnamed protein product [Vitrella brassicaformis CCMP3155]
MSVLDLRRASPSERTNLIVKFCEHRIRSRGFPASGSYRLRGHYGCVNAISFSPDGELLASGSDDCRVLLWKVGRRKRLPIAEFEDVHESNIFSVVFNASRSHLLSGGNDGQITRIAIENPRDRLSYAWDPYEDNGAIFQVSWVDPPSPNLALASFSRGPIRLVDFRVPGSSAGGYPGGHGGVRHRLVLRETSSVLGCCAHPTERYLFLFTSERNTAIQDYRTEGQEPLCRFMDVRRYAPEGSQATPTDLLVAPILHPSPPRPPPSPDSSDERETKRRRGHDDGRRQMEILMVRGRKASKHRQEAESDERPAFSEDPEELCGSDDDGDEPGEDFLSSLPTFTVPDPGDAHSSEEPTAAPAPTHTQSAPLEEACHGEESHDSVDLSRIEEPIARRQREWHRGRGRGRGGDEPPSGAAAVPGDGGRERYLMLADRLAVSFDATMVLVIRRHRYALVYPLTSDRLVYPVFELRSRSYSNDVTQKYGSFLSDNRHVVLGSDDCNIHMWRLPDNTRQILKQHKDDRETRVLWSIGALSGHKGIVNCVTCAPPYPLSLSPPTIASAGIEKHIRIWTTNNDATDDCDTYVEGPNDKFVCPRSRENDNVVRRFNDLANGAAVGSLSGNGDDNSDEDELL